jgi:Ca2+-binding RTX toxin-like protein
MAYAGGAGAGVVNMSESGNLGVVEYAAAPGEVNNLTVASCGAGCVNVVDSGADVFGGWGFSKSYGCFTLEASALNGLFSARCTHPIAMRTVAAVLDDMNDRISLTLPSSVVTLIGGGSGDDRLIGGPEIDNLYANAGDDSLSGGGNCDDLEGGPGMDTLDGGPGPDLIWGDTGIDTVDYTSRSAHVFVALDLSIAGGNCTGAPFGNDGELGEGDNVDPSVENIRGGAANDSLFGGAAANALSGGGGDDLLDGGGGPDDISGGFGFDTADYSSRATAVNVTLDDVANDGAGEADNVLSDIERINGGAANDILTGDLSNNELHGNDGNDTLRGNGGTDRLFGEGGDDSLNVHDMDVDDTIDCGSGNDNSAADAIFPRPRSLALVEPAPGCENPIWIFPLQLGP